MSEKVNIVCQCGKKHKIHKENAGLKFACPSCGRMMVIPKNLGESQEQEDKMTVLVVDDVAAIRAIMRKHLEKRHYNVLEAEDGLEAIKSITFEKPDLIILDYIMPKKNGLEVVKHVRNSEKNDDIPILICSSKADKNTIISCVQAGANDYIVKPFTGPLLMEKVSKLMADLRVKQHEKRTATAQNKKPSAATE